MDSCYRYFPLTFFSAIMGLAGFALAWQRAEAVLGIPVPISLAWYGVAVVAFAAMLFFYLQKLLRHRDEVWRELLHPIKHSFLPTISISVLLLATLTHAYWVAGATALWILGGVLQLSFTLFVMSLWMDRDQFEINHLNPAWFIPVVGTLFVPMIGAKVAWIEISWFFFSIGLAFWAVLLVIIFYRVIFHRPLPDKLVPTFFILVAPPAVGFIAYQSLHPGTLDGFGRVLYYLSLYTFLLLGTLFPKFKKLQFFLSWWAYSFPIAALTIATLLMYAHTQHVVFHGLSLGLLGLLTGLIFYLAWRTVLALRAGKVCVADG